MWLIFIAFFRELKPRKKCFWVLLALNEKLMLLQKRFWPIVVDETRSECKMRIQIEIAIFLSQSFCTLCNYLCVQKKKKKKVAKPWAHSRSLKWQHSTQWGQGFFEGAVTFICNSDLMEYCVSFKLSFTQFICTHYSCFENTGQFVTVASSIFE